MMIDRYRDIKIHLLLVKERHFNSHTVCIRTLHQKTQNSCVDPLKINSLLLYYYLILIL